MTTCQVTVWTLGDVTGRPWFRTNGYRMNPVNCAEYGDSSPAGGGARETMRVQENKTAPAARQRCESGASPTTEESTNA